MPASGEGQLGKLPNASVSMPVKFYKECSRTSDHKTVTRSLPVTGSGSAEAQVNSTREPLAHGDVLALHLADTNGATTRSG